MDCPGGGGRFENSCHSGAAFARIKRIGGVWTGRTKARPAADGATGLRMKVQTKITFALVVVALSGGWDSDYDRQKLPDSEEQKGNEKQSSKPLTRERRRIFDVLARITLMGQDGKGHRHHDQDGFQKIAKTLPCRIRQIIWIFTPDADCLFKKTVGRNTRPPLQRKLSTSFRHRNLCALLCRMPRLLRGAGRTAIRPRNGANSATRILLWPVVEPTRASRRVTALQYRYYGAAGPPIKAS